MVTARVASRDEVHAACQTAGWSEWARRSDTAPIISWSVYDARFAWNIKHHRDVIQHYSHETASTTHDLLQLLYSVTMWHSARHARELYDGWFARTSDIHYYVTQHSSCETASTMQDLLKNQWIFNIFENFHFFLKWLSAQNSGYRIFPNPSLAGSQTICIHLVGNQFSSKSTRWIASYDHFYTMASLKIILTCSAR